MSLIWFMNIFCHKTFSYLWHSLRKHFLLMLDAFFMSNGHFFLIHLSMHYGDDVGHHENEYVYYPFITIIDICVNLKD